MYKLVSHRVTIMEKSRLVSAAVGVAGEEVKYFVYDLEGSAWWFEREYRNKFQDAWIHVVVLPEA